MDDRLFFPLVGLAAAGLIALAAVWPQGLGARSPEPFGHAPVQQSPEMQQAMAREIARLEREKALAEAAEAKAKAEATAAAAGGEPLR